VDSAHERDDVAARELLDHLLKAAGHDALEVLAHCDHTLGSPLSMIVCSSTAKPLPRKTTTIMFV
jgi:hypothetical protein